MGNDGQRDRGGSPEFARTNKHIDCGHCGNSGRVLGLEMGWGGGVGPGPEITCPACHGKSNVREPKGNDMIVASGVSEDGATQLLLLGLTAENAEELKKGRPMYLKPATHPGIPEGLAVAICYGETAQHIFDELKAQGLLGQAIVVRRGPPAKEQPAEKRVAKISGPSQNARKYEHSVPEIQWSCCPGVICGSARRTGVTPGQDDLAVYRLSSQRHPQETGRSVVVAEDGTLLKWGPRTPVEIA